VTYRASGSWKCGGTTWPAGPQAAGPAAQLEYLGDFSRHPARVVRHIRPAISERDDARSRAGVVPVDVAPAGLGRVRRLAIEFHSHPELRIAIVEVADALADPTQCLPFGAREAMRPFDAPDVTPLQDRVDAISDVAECVGQLSSPPQFRPHLNGGEQCLCGDESARAGTGEPGDGLVQVRCRLSQVESGFFDASSRRSTGWMNRSADLGRIMYDHERHTPATLLCSEDDSSRTAHNYVDGIDRPVSETVHFGGGVIAERRSSPGPQDARPQHCPARWSARIRGVNTVVEPLPTAAAQPGIYRSDIEADLGCLPAGYYAVLEV